VFLAAVVAISAPCGCRGPGRCALALAGDPTRRATGGGARGAAA